VAPVSRDGGAELGPDASSGIDALGIDAGAPLDAGSSLDASAPTDAGLLPCAVAAVLDARCTSCHGDPLMYGAPMPLLRYADLLAPLPSDPSKHVYEQVRVRIHDDAHPMPQPPNPRLTASELMVLDSWIASAAPSGSTCDGGVTQDDAGTPPPSCAPDTRLAPASPWSMPADVAETYVCYGIDAVASAKRHITGFAPHVDNGRLIHHLILLESDVSVSSTPAPCELGGAIGWRPLFGWAPGGSSFELPPEAGFAEDSTTHFVVQAHYVNPTHATGLSDASGFDLCTTDQLRANDADVLAFGTESILIPPESSLTRTCDVQVPFFGDTLHLFAAFPHMHGHGTSIYTIAFPQGGVSPIDLGSQPTWRFGEQGWIPISYVLQPGDTVRSRCSWQNDTASSIVFGESSANEMCFSFTMYYPKVTNPAWSWPLPALYSVCR
jgi:hypothetical protein